MADSIVLYWKRDFYARVRAIYARACISQASIRHLIKLFLKCLIDIGGIKDEEIGFDIFVEEDKKDRVKDLIDYWAEITGFYKDGFSHIYFQKAGPKRKIKKINKNKYHQKAHFGLLRIRG